MFVGQQQQDDAMNFSEQNSKTRLILLAALVLAVGIAAAGWFVSHGLGRVLAEGRLADRTVSVKGLSERNAKADLALWEIRYVATSENLATAQGKIEGDGKLIAAFLTQQGLLADSITPQRVEVIDLLAQQYRSEGASQSRFIVTASLMVRSGDVDLVQSISRKTGELIKQGVVFTNEGTPFTGPYFLFTKLNDVKLEMIAEATKNARAAAEQFATDSGVRVGAIARANQGQFSILPGDNWPGAEETKQINKTIRVVSTVDFMLGD
jgi:uncharacterized protein